MQYEERNQYTQTSNTNGIIYKWNIDGMTVYIYIHKSIELSIIDLSDSRLIQPLTNSIEQTISIRPSVDG